MTSSENINQKVIEWAYKYLVSHGYKLKNHTPENVQDTPWSYIVRFVTFDGYIYLKYTPELLALEASIIQILRTQFDAPVPKILAHNTELNCFLMQDAGKSLREVLKQKFDAELICKTIDQFTSLQLVVADHIDILLNLGVPDWRLDKLPYLYTKLLAQKDILIADGLSEIEMIKLEKLLPAVSNLCKKLSSYPIKQTIVQPDFNDNNILIDDISQNITIIDLGEIAISHPFFSLLNFLQQIKKYHALTDKDDLYQKIKDYCLKNYISFDSKQHLLDAFEITSILYFIYGALGCHRLMTACDNTRFTSSFQMQGRVSIPLKEFLAIKNTFFTL